MRVPDNYDAYRQHEAEREKWLKSRPICVYCEEPIQDDFLYEVNGELYCEECMQKWFRQSTEDYER